MALCSSANDGQTATVWEIRFVSRTVTLGDELCLSTGHCDVGGVLSPMSYWRVVLSVVRIVIEKLGRSVSCARGKEQASPIGDCH